MDNFPSYRQLLLESLITYDDCFFNLVSWTVEFIFHEDELTGNCPFEEGDPIPLDMDLFKNSDIFEVQQSYKVMLKLLDVCDSIQNINNITDDEGRAFYPLNWQPSLLMFYREGNDWDDLKTSLADLFRVIACRILSQCYDIVFREDRSRIPDKGFSFPNDRAFVLLQSDDVNVNNFLGLASFILDKRNLIKTS